MKNIPIAPKAQDEIASLLALGILRLKMREKTANKALMKRKALDFRADTVLADGFSFDGRKYKSLSRIAQIITGKIWSGPAFFGLVGKKGEL